MKHAPALLAFAGLALVWMPAQAADLYRHDSWSALASDRNARHVGDALTIIVYQSATATGTATNGSQRASNFGGQIAADATFTHSANLGLNSGSNSTGTTGRSGAMVAEISAVVDKVLPNGDLHITGAQVLDINGERTNIRVEGRVRAADIAADNTVISSRLADAAIDYDGTGFVTRSSAPGLVTRIFNWLGIF